MEDRGKFQDQQTHTEDETYISSTIPSDKGAHYDMFSNLYTVEIHGDCVEV